MKTLLSGNSLVLQQEAFDNLPLEPAVTPGADAVDLEQPVVTPPPYSILMNIEQTSSIAGCKHAVFSIITCHIISILISYLLRGIKTITQMGYSGLVKSNAP